MKREEVVFLEDVELAHQRAIERWGGSDGVLDRRKLLSAVMAPRNGHFTSLCEYAGAYAIGLTLAHPFVDGNKRAAIGAAGMFLGANGHLVALDVDEWEELSLSIAGKHATQARPTLEAVASLFADAMGDRGVIQD